MRRCAREHADSLMPCWSRRRLRSPDAAHGEQLLPDSLEPSLHERVSQAVQAVVLRTGS